MAVAAGILTASGGRTSHAAVVARQLGNFCLGACPKLAIVVDKRAMHHRHHNSQESDLLSLDGNIGAVHLGRLTAAIERPEQALATITSWHPSA